MSKPALAGVLEETYSGSRLSACNGQSGLGQLMADALKWYAETQLTDLQHPVIGLFNGGNVRNFLYAGEVTELDIQDAVHGSMDGVAVVHMTGAQLLELLEAATQRENCPGWAYVAGLSYEVDLSKAYDFGAAYGPYYKANSVNRVSVTSQGFDPEATYAVVADRLLLAGEDTYYMLKGLETVAEGMDVTTILTLYIREVLNTAR
jgi:2',3'-cyclic-nucleotide 2'-phosphodiesterase (5'-nucleotidase family)